MYRHSPVRNPRPKGIKIKHVLQICLLVAVCFWLIFQVKRSHDKKKEFDASDPKISLNTRTEEVVKFGRKDLQPKLDGTKKEIEKHEEEQEQEEQEENKNEEEEQDEDKIEDGGGGGDDEIDENEIEKSDVEIDREEVDEEIDEKENEEKDGQSQSESQSENGVPVDENDQDGATRNTREAREEHYKADDASSAVTHGIENRNVTLDNASLIDNEMAKNRPLLNATLILLESTRDQNTTEGVPNSRMIDETEKTLDLSEGSEVESDEGEGENREEGLDSYETKNPDEVEHEAIDSSDGRDAEIETEGGNSEDTGAE